MRWIFRFYDDSGKVHWEAPLVVSRCKATTKNGIRCSNMTALVHPYCMECLPKKLHVVVSESKLGPKIGKGLFAYDENKSEDDIIFKRGSYIAPYLGEIVTKQELRKRYCDAFTSKLVEYVTTPYVYNTGKCRVDGALLRGPAVYSNDTIGTKYRHNAVLDVNVHDDICLYATRDIVNGEEIFCDYGIAYWTGYHFPFETIYE